MTASPTEPRGVLFDIQRLSLQDGPGVRTSLFLKGCPLRCAWCHNPESRETGTQLQYIEGLCAGCGACAQVCRRGVHTFTQGPEGMRHEVRHSLCDGCGECVKVCCYGALALLGKRYTADEILGLVEGDRPYFERPDARGETGGITLTGGEPMMQFPFVKALLERKGSLHACMETCGYAPTERFEEILPLTDLFLFDYKATDPDLHRALCGQDNRLILRNLEFLYARGAEIILRLPLIPGVNDGDGHLRAIAEFLKSHPRIGRAEVMAYHRLGVGKAKQLGMEGLPVDLPNAAPEQKAAWLERLRELGARNVILG
ncbi:MAG TPA: glycyl-radical enzyme activating protein [Candidatus Limnocylindria bacterium]|nr:glycyl-radical enzyme activating protein [Candidatus Limnocylindria bacterium]